MPNATLTWSGWDAQYQLNVAAGYYSDTIWNLWTNNAAAATYTTTVNVQPSTYYSDTWRAWNINAWNIKYSTQNIRYFTPSAHAAPARYTAPLVHVGRTEAEWEAIRVENERLRAERDAVQAEARREARRLLEVVLTPEQLKTYDKLGYFDVRGSEGGVFRIKHGTSGNVSQLVDGATINRLCAHPRLLDHRADEGEGVGYLPTEDVVLSQALSLMHDELGFVGTANVHAGQRHLRTVA